MALEAVVYPQDPFSLISCKDIQFHDFYFQQEDNQDPLDTKNNIKLGQEQRQGLPRINYNGKSVDTFTNDDYNYNDQEEDLRWPRDDHLYGSALDEPPPSDVAAGGGRRKRRRRTKSSKNKEEIENQRMTHIAVERNRRKQMNDYLAVLRSLMPPSYAQRGDQASIVGGAINYLKELEHHLQSIEPPLKSTTVPVDTESASPAADQINTIAASSLGQFSEFFAFPQYSSRPSSSSVAEGMAEIEVTMVESHASVKILAKKRPKQLLKLAASIQNLKLTVLHLNVTTCDDSVLYSISLKVEEGSQLNTVEDIAAGMNQILRRIEEESS
ncbi:hypothetical protein BRARA_B02008 [Brassica rapa]|uniref:BHLH domain-containing protein n=3 Tax=Brassica TaxID=3705 RepID=A0ABQ8E9U5_BRANA|nr:transcription factor bHLH96-like isoform X2 [Brassica napus]KAG5409854.1 hypothetical protein IGI04_006173 [Brassica rapa subsp. trilocularis]KAH0938385.1 hypothetical protein HID58_005846 [Brassica napus]RID74933.1 hypothetical protein BRARA_B02008 [Brassica rapa]